MQRLLSPNHTSSLVSYSNSTIECLERCDVAEDSSTLISGSTFSNGKLAWLARGSSLEVVNTKTGQRKAAWRFGWSSKHKRAVTITSVVAFPMGKADRLVVGLKDLSGSLPGMVCLFDPYVSRVIKAVVIPYAVTSLECVLTCGGADAPSSLLSLHLKLYFGIVAVGTEQGHTYLLDMRLDDDMEKFDEWNPSTIEHIDCTVQNISKYRESARRNDTHLAAELGGECHQSSKFYYNKSDSRDEKIYPAGDVVVTAIKYIHQGSCLVIGYNFGCFLIWDLSSMMLVYNSQVDQYNMSAVTHMAYQEPENDPHSCSYLWVARGPLMAEDEPLDVPTTLTLYQLIFSAREVLPGYGIVYKGLSGCGRRFEHQLTADAHHLADATSVGSKVICCYTLKRENVSHDVSKAEEGVTRDLTLTVCVWEAPSPDPLSSPTCHLGIFDINRWYHSQMQPSLRDAMFGSKDSTCPFFAFFSLAEILEVASPDGIVDVYIDSNAVTRFMTNNEPAMEQHYWPASLKFDACCLMETGIVHAKFLGMQRQILASLRQEGISSLLEAHSYFNMCWAAGLLPRNFDMSKSHDKNFQLEAIMSVCLEHGLVVFIISCIDKLGVQTVGPAGFTLKLILDWSWTKVVHLKEQLDQLCVPLFDGGGGTPDDQMLLLLDNMAVQLAHLKAIFQTLLNQSETSSLQGLKDLTDKYNVVSILSVYLKLLLWLIRHGILPDQSVDEDSHFVQREFGYSSASFKKYYDARKSEMHALGGDLASIDLMIDKIVSQFDGLWLSTVGKEEYPPSSLHALCSLYLLDKVPSETKHSVVFYFLLDMCSISSDLNDINVADRFAQAFDMPQNLAKMMKAIWFLDHKDFENAMTQVVDPSQTKVIGPWQNSYIIKTLLLQGEFQKALHFMNTVRPTMHAAEDVRLHLSVLLANGLVTEAFNFQRCHRNPSINADLLMHFFAGCQQNGNISKVMQLPLNGIEEDYFVDFLQHDSFEASKELLVMYYLQRGRYVEGIRLNEAIKQDTMNEQNPKLLERTKVRNAIVDGYIKCLPSIQRKLIFMPDKKASHYPTMLKEVPRPKPLSTVTHQVSHGRPVSHASILNSVMDKVTEARPQTTPQKRRSGAFVGTPLTPGTKSLLYDSHRMVFAAMTKPEVVFEETKTLIGPTLLDKKRRKQLYSGADALILLTSPKIVKRPLKHGVPSDSITVSTTPQSILKVSRVVRRSVSPRASPTTAPPLLRRGQSDKTIQDANAKDKDLVDFRPEPEIASRRIRFAAEDSSPSPTSSKPADVTLEADVDESEDVPMETERDSAAVRGVSFMDATDASTDATEQVSTDSLTLELSSSTEEEKEEEEGEPEVQITAAVVELRASSDLEEEAHDEEDYSSYELDESDNVIAEDSEEEVLSRRDSHSDRTRLSITSESQIPDTPKDRGSSPNAGLFGNDIEGPLMRSSPQTPASTSSEDQPSRITRSSPLPMGSPPKHTVQPKTSPQPSSIERHIKMTTLRATVNLTMTPPKSPQSFHVSLAAHSKEVQIAQETDSYAFSPPVVLRTPRILDASTTVDQPPENGSTPATDFFFSPPLTRSMLKRRSIEVSHHGTTASKTDTPEVSIMGRSLRPRSESSRYTPHQSPSDSPISFLSPAPSQPTSPQGSKRGSAKKPVPLHKMTLRSRLGKTRSAKLPQH